MADVLTREEFAILRMRMARSVSSFEGERQLTAHDAAQRARIAELEQALESERTRWQQEHALFVESDAANTQLAGELEAAKADTALMDELEQLIYVWSMVTIPVAHIWKLILKRGHNAAMRSQEPGTQERKSP